MRVLALLLLVLLALPALAQEAYVSPYGLEFTMPLEGLTSDFDREPWNSVEEQSVEPPFARWNEPTAYTRGISWGPRSRQYPRPEVPDGVDSLVWRRERLIATAQRYLGYEYQHHHIPDWLPPEEWPSRTPRRARGLDCSNFTSWVYNYGLGMRFDSHVGRQAELAEGERLLDGERDYATLLDRLETGDLLFLRGKGRISHVVMWVGDPGRPTDEPLVVDSTATSVKDSRGVTIPTGVNLRPFRQGAWYHRAFDHALRFVR